MNSLYQAVLNKIRRIPSILPPIRSLIQPRLTAATIPFAMGRVYQCIYKNYKTDPRPVIFILSSNAFYTHGIALHHLGGMTGMLFKIIMDLRRSNRPMTGMIIYKYIKMKAPAIPKLAYRVYFTKYLVGKLVSDGVSQIPMPGKNIFVSEPMVRALNQMIRPKIINPYRMTQNEIDNLKTNMDKAVISADQTIIGRKR